MNWLCRDPVSYIKRHWHIRNDTRDTRGNTGLYYTVRFLQLFIIRLRLWLVIHYLHTVLQYHTIIICLVDVVTIKQSWPKSQFGLFWNTMITCLSYCHYFSRTLLIAQIILRTVKCPFSTVWDRGRQVFNYHKTVTLFSIYPRMFSAHRL